jgi:hypothetical protein
LLSSWPALERPLQCSLHERVLRLLVSERSSLQNINQSINQTELTKKLKNKIILKSSFSFPVIIIIIKN